jgi:hypothetical protein
MKSSRCRQKLTPGTRFIYRVIGGPAASCGLGSADQCCNIRGQDEFGYLNSELTLLLVTAGTAYRYCGTDNIQEIKTMEDTQNTVT